MKKLILTAAFLVATTFGVMAQGSVDFHNEYWQAWGDTVDRGVYFADGRLIDDPTWSAQLVETADGATWTALGGPTFFYGPGLDGVFAFDGAPRTATQGTLAVEIYDGAGALVARSPSFQFQEGASVPPAPKDKFIVNFTAFTVPEPSTIALGVLGLGALLLFRRRK